MEMPLYLGRKVNFHRDVLGLELCQLTDLKGNSVMGRAMGRSGTCHMFGVRGEEKHPKKMRIIPCLLLFVNKCALCWVWT